MTTLIPTDPDSLANAARDVGAIIKCVPGLFNALYETMGYYWTDPIKRKRRIKNLEAELEMAEAMLKGKKRLEDISATLAKEVLEPAMEEDREELQKLWAALLARIMTGQDAGLTSSVIDIVKKFQPLDAIALEEIEAVSNASFGKGRPLSTIQTKIRQKCLMDEDTLSLALADSSQRLMELGCIRYGLDVPGALYNGPFSEGSPLRITSRGTLVRRLVEPPVEEV